MTATVPRSQPLTVDEGGSLTYRIDKSKFTASYTIRIEYKDTGGQVIDKATGKPRKKPADYSETVQLEVIMRTEVRLRPLKPCRDVPTDTKGCVYEDSHKGPELLTNTCATTVIGRSEITCTITSIIDDNCHDDRLVIVLSYSGIGLVPTSQENDVARARVTKSPPDLRGAYLQDVTVRDTNCRQGDGPQGDTEFIEQARVPDNVQGSLLSPTTTTVAPPPPTTTARPSGSQNDQQTPRPSVQGPVTPSGTPPAVKSTVPVFSDLGGAPSVLRAALNSLVADGVFAGLGCGGGKLCPNEPIPRWEMAVALVRVIDGEDPAAAQSSRFSDVAASRWWASHVERLADLGVTEGCAAGPLRYCPDGAVTRAQMASFFKRAFSLPAAVPAGFADTSGSVHEAHIDALYAAGITAGCSTGPLKYCPDSAVTRAQMATFLSRAIAHRDN